MRRERRLLGGTGECGNGKKQKGHEPSDPAGQQSIGHGEKDKRWRERDFQNLPRRNESVKRDLGVGARGLGSVGAWDAWDAGDAMDAGDDGIEK
jgi:hypothetical protein